MQRGLNNAKKEQMGLYRLPQKVTTACFILGKNLQVIYIYMHNYKDDVISY